jgi:hypothetical protein
MAMAAMTTMSEAEYLRRRAVSEMALAIASTSPPQFAFHIASQRYDALVRRRSELRAAGADTDAITDEIVACGEQLMKLADLIEVQWSALNTMRLGPLP